MARLTERDKQCYDYLVSTRLPCSSSDLAKLFYHTGNPSSEVVICNRRLKVMKELQYVEQYPRKFGTENIFYVGSKPNEKSLRHRLLFTHVIATIATNGFDVDFKSIEIEKQLLDGELRCDVFMTISYNNKKYQLIIECDTSKEFNVNGYTKLINKLKKGEIKFNYPLLILSICDFKIEDEIKKYVIQIKTDLSDFSKFQYQFIK